MLKLKGKKIGLVLSFLLSNAAIFAEAPAFLFNYSLPVRFNNLDFPVGIVVDSQTGSSFVVSRLGHISRHDAKGNLIVERIPFPFLDDGIIAMNAVGLDSVRGFLYTVDEGGRMFKFDYYGRLLKRWDISSHFYGSLSGLVWGIAIQETTGRIYIADAMDGLIKVYDSEGNKLFEFGDRDFFRPRNIAFDPSEQFLYVAQTSEGGGFHQGIYKYTAAGSLVLTWGSKGSGDGQFVNPFGVAVSSDGIVYATDGDPRQEFVPSGNNRVQAFSPTGDFLFKFGAQGTGDGQFFEPNGLTVTPQGTIYVTDGRNYRVSVWGLTPASYPAITSITPKKIVFSTSPVTMVIKGLNFQVGASVRLSRFGSDDIVATIIDISSIQINATFISPLYRGGGEWDMVITNPDGAQAFRYVYPMVSIRPVPPFTIATVPPPSHAQDSFPVGVAVDTRASTLFVVSHSLSRDIKRFDLRGQELPPIAGYFPNSDKPNFNSPNAIAVDTQRKFIYVVDETPRVWKIDYNGNSQKKQTQLALIIGEVVFKSIPLPGNLLCSGAIAAARMGSSWPHLVSP
ncbi:MAG: hypothetical protein HY747_03570 [Elusimicrobia bacterium]|nr:hypothetical protein [Elusimicrobiota bacterium]